MHLKHVIIFCVSALITGVVGIEVYSQQPPGSTPFDIQGHRGSRGYAVENLLPSFAWALLEGASTLELDNGITKDGVVVTWHDEMILPTKCRDTAPAFEGDPMFPYIGKYIADLTLAQIKTLDCGSLRSHDFPMQILCPGTKISTLREVFDFVKCVDTRREVRWNIESKINPLFPNRTLGVNDFVDIQHAEFVASSYEPSQITYQSFDWRTLVEMKARYPRIVTSALVDRETATTVEELGYPWLAGLDLDLFPGDSLGDKIVHAAASINADVISPAAVFKETSSSMPSGTLHTPFTTPEMISTAHERGISVIPWTVNRADVAESLMDWGVDGIISDYPGQLRRWVMHRGLPVTRKAFPRRRIWGCLEEHLQKQKT